LKARAGRAIGQALALNTTLTRLSLGHNHLGAGGLQAIGQALAVNRVLTDLDLSSNDIGTKGARKIGQALQVNRALTTLHPDYHNLNYREGDYALAREIQRLVVVNRAPDTKLLAVMMSMHAHLGAESGLRVLEDHLVTLICDLFCLDSKASSLFGKAGVFACPGNHRLKTGAITRLRQRRFQACCDVCLKTLPVGTRVLSCRACDWDGCRDCHAEAKR
jgi:hypothetical protein